MTPPRWLKHQSNIAAPFLWLTVALGTANGLLLILQAWLLARIIDTVIFADAGTEQISVWLWSLLPVFVIRAVLAWLAERSAVVGATRAKLTLRDRLYRHIQALGPGFTAGERTGALTETLTRGIEDLTAYYARFLPAMSLTALIPLSILVVVFPVDWLSGLMMLLTAPLIPLFMILIGKGAERLNQRQWKQLTRMSGHFLDVIQGLTTLKLFGASRREAELIARISDDYRVSTMQVLRVAFLSSAVLEFFATVSVAIIAVFIGFRLYQLDLPIPDWAGVPEIGFFHGLFVLLLAPEFYLPLRNLGSHYHGRMEGIAAAERMIDVLEMPTSPAAVDGGCPPLSRPFGIRFEDVRFAYAAGRDALNGTKFEIRPGQRVALVGPSGAGKTTVIQLLLGFHQPDAGRILVNNKGLMTLNPAYWRTHLAWVPQVPRLFQGSILDNIRLGSPDADLDAVETAARAARADGFIADLPHGYQTRIGEHGVGLSGGQIQRIALARALLRDAPFVILDEPTASLDPASEAAVRTAIDDLARGRTLLTVAHRLETVRRADHILVMEQGRIVEQGTHSGLSVADGLYRRLISAYASRDQL